jgi:hypothetical protein
MRRTRRRPVPTGEPVNYRRTAIKVLALVALAFLGIVAVSYVTDPTFPDGRVRDESPHGPRNGSLNQTVWDGDFSFRVTGMQDDPSVGTNQPRGKYIVVTMTVTNSGTEPQSFYVQNQTLIGRDGNGYVPDPVAASVANDGSAIVVNLNPDFMITMDIPFDVPKGTIADRIELHGAASSGGATVTLS